MRQDLVTVRRSGGRRGSSQLVQATSKLAVTQDVAIQRDKPPTQDMAGQYIVDRDRDKHLRIEI